MQNPDFKYLQQLLDESGLNQCKLSKAIGISQGTLSDWKNQRTYPKIATLKKIADYFKVSLEFFTDGKNEDSASIPSYPLGSIIAMPVIGTVKAGYGGYCSEEYTGEYMSITTDDLKGYSPTECRIIRVTGDSMYPVIVDGDTVIVHLQPDVDNDEIAVVLNGDNEATLKRVRKSDDVIELIPRNPEYQRKKLTKQEFIDGRYRIYGKVLRLMREF